MKGLQRHLCILLLISWSTIYAQHDVNEQMVILIDAGHGGIDSGAISKGGIKEKDIVLDIARRIKESNNALLASRYDIYMTRSSDTLISLNDRVRLAIHLKPDLFISLHCNHSDDSQVRGIELYTYDTDGSSPLIANFITVELNKKLGFKIRKVKQADFEVLRETTGSCPAILLELGYLSNEDESNYLGNQEKRKALSLAILIGLGCINAF